MTTLNPPDVRLTREQRTVLTALATDPAGMIRLGARTRITPNGSTVSGQAARNLAATGLAAVIHTYQDETPPGSTTSTVAVITPLGHAFLELTCPHCAERIDRPPAGPMPAEALTTTTVERSSVTVTDLGELPLVEPSSDEHAIEDAARAMGDAAADDLLRSIGALS